MKTTIQQGTAPLFERLSFRSLTLLICGMLLLARAGYAADAYESFTFDGKYYQKARLLETTPVDLLFLADNAPGGLRIKRDDLPAELKEKYAFDAVRAAEFGQQKVLKVQAQREQQRTLVYAGLLRQERELQSKIDARINELVALQKDIKAWRSKRRVPGKALALDQLINKKMDLTHHIDNLRKQLDGVRQQQASFR